MSIFARFALCCGVVVLLAGCGAPSSGGAPSGIGIQSNAHRASGKSWMKPDAKGAALVYIDSSGLDEIHVYTYPGGQSAGTLTGFDNPLGLCSDAQGNVWVTNAPSNGNSYLLEYAHGGTKPIAKLDDSGFLPLACSVDATTGNLAVGNSLDDLAIWTKDRGKPRHYLTSCCVFAPETVTYDSAGDAIFADFTTRDGWLPNAHSKVKKMALHPHLRAHGAFFWDGTYLSVFASSQKPRQEELVRYTFSNGTASEVGTVPLQGVSGAASDSQFWIQGSKMVLVAYGSGNAYIFDYPKGGRPTKTIADLYEPFGVTVSVAAPPAMTADHQ